MESKNGLFGLHRSTVAFGLAFTLGLVAIYGLGHIYLGKAQRGLMFLASAAIPFGIVLPTLFWPEIYPFYVSTIAWAAIWILQLWDLKRMAKEAT